MECEQIFVPSMLQFAYLGHNIVSQPDDVPGAAQIPSNFLDEVLNGHSCAELANPGEVQVGKSA